MLSAVIKMYPVVFVAQLEPAKACDPYKNKRPNHPGPVKIEDATLYKSIKTHDATPLSSFYKVEQILNKQVQRYGRKTLRVEYRVKWVGWEPKWNQ